MTIKKRKSGKIKIDLMGPQGNAYYLLRTARNLAKQLGKDAEKITKEMASNDCEHLLKVFDREFGNFVTFYR